jgi:hypothetical protein
MEIETVPMEKRGRATVVQSILYCYIDSSSFSSSLKRFTSPKPSDVGPGKYELGN